MSTILKALRRLEEAKTVQMPRPLREQVATPPAPRRGLGWIAACGAALAGVALGAVGFLVWPSIGRDFDARRGGRAEFAGEATATPETVAAELPKVAPPPDLADAVSGSPGSLADAVSGPPGSLADVVSGLPGSQPAAVATATTASESFPPPAAPPVVTAARREAPAAGSGRSRPPPVEPIKRVRAFIPSVLVVRTVWHPTAERRIAEIEVEGRPELLLLHEGDAVGPLVVSEIRPSGVVFLHDEVELVRHVGIR